MGRRISVSQLISDQKYTITRLEHTVHVSARLVITHPTSSSPFSNTFASSCTLLNFAKLCVRAYAPQAAIYPVCLMPPPNSLRKWRALFMNFDGPTRIEPMGAPSHKVINPPRQELLGWKESGDPPNPLLKHKLTLSNGSHSSFILIPL